MLDRSMPQDDALARHGDALYRVALLLAPDARLAERALRAAFRQPGTLTTGIGLDDLLPPLLAALAPPARTGRTRRGKLAPLDAVAALPFAQRRALVLHLLLGIGLIDAARLSAIPGDAARGDYAAALSAVAVAIGQPLPADQSSEQCASVRALIAQQSASAADEALVRGHAALCDACRSFERACAALAQQAEAALRARVRDVRMPPALASALRQPAVGRRQQLGALVARVGARRLALALVPAGVLLLIAALVLPGFWHAPAWAPTAADAPPPNALALARRAHFQLGQPPAGQGALWHGRWQAQWHFPAGTSAPLVLDAWLDPHSARHRLQVTHAQGGAPFELQIGSGDELHYALAASYYESLYGALPASNQPQLARWKLGVPAQQRALRERMAAGAWGLPAAYLRQAQAAPDLRVLGRQRDGERQAWLLGYTGLSPLGLPADAPQVTGDGRVRVLLALDAEDGHLLSVTELTDSGGGAQASQVTWRLLSEEWLPNENAARAALDPQRSWNGRGTFPAEPQGADVDPTLLLADSSRLSGLEALLTRTAPQLVLPDAPPGAQRALVLWNSASRGAPYQSNAIEEARVVYLGTGRQLTLSWRHNLLGGGDREAITLPGWQVELEARRGQVYRLEADARTTLPSDQGGTPHVVIEARGYTRAELLALVGSLGQLDLERWRAQRQLFAGASGVDAPARTLLEAVADAAQPPAPATVQYQRLLTFARRSSQPDPLPDPFHMPAYVQQPAAAVQETWLRVVQAGGQVDALWRTSAITDGSVLWSGANIGEKGWYYNGPRRSLSYYTTGVNSFGLPTWLPPGALAALDLLANPGDGVRVENVSNKGRAIVRERPITPDEIVPDTFYISGGGNFTNPAVADLRPTRVITTLTLDINGKAVQLSTSVESDAAGTETPVPSSTILVQQWDLEAQRLLPLADAPVELRSGAPPSEPVRYVYANGTSSGQFYARTVTISDALALTTTPLLVPPPSAETALLKIEAGRRGPNNERSDSTDDPFYDAVRNGVALRLTYRLPGQIQVTLYQGPADALADYIRTHYAAPVWQWSVARRFTLAGREVSGWLLENPNSARDSYLVAEHDGTLVILAAEENRLLARGEDFLAQLEPLK